MFAHSHQKGLASPPANMFQCQPDGREARLVCAYAGVRWGCDPLCCHHTSASFTTVTLPLRVQTQGADRRRHAAHYCVFLLARPKQLQTVSEKEKSNALGCRFAFGRVKLLRNTQDLTPEYRTHR